MKGYFNKISKDNGLGANIGGHFFYDILNKSSNVSALVFLESSTFQLDNNLIDNQLDFNYEVDFKATNLIAKALGLSLFNTKFIVNKENILDARFAIETVQNNGTFNLNLFLVS